MKIFLSIMAWAGIGLIYWAVFEIAVHTVWVPNLALLMVIILGLYARREVAGGVALVLAVGEQLTGNSLSFHLLWYPAVALGLNYFFYNVFRSHPVIFRATHMGLVVADLLLALLWGWLMTQTWPAFQPLALLIFLALSSATAYALRYTGFGLFEDRKTDSVWRKSSTYRLAFKS